MKKLTKNWLSYLNKTGATTMKMGDLIGVVITMVAMDQTTCSSDSSTCLALSYPAIPD